MAWWVCVFVPSVPCQKGLGVRGPEGHRRLPRAPAENRASESCSPIRRELVDPAAGTGAPCSHPTVLTLNWEGLWPGPCLPGRHQRKSIAQGVGGGDHLHSREDIIRTWPSFQGVSLDSRLLGGVCSVAEGTQPQPSTPGQVPGQLYLWGADLGTECNGSSRKERLDIWAYLGKYSHQEGVCRLWFQNS